MRILFAVLLLAQLAFASAPLTLLPQPASVQTTGADFALANGFAVKTPSYTDARLQRAIDRAVTRMQERTITILPRDGASTFIVDCKSKGSDIPQLGDDESYSLEVTAQQITLKSNTVTGSIRGLETLVQLVTPTHGGYILPGVVIQDQPRFPWRGLMIDVSRHFQSIELIKRNLDALAAAKMNVFHWHLTDDQGFRIESKKFPKLQGMGSDGLFYTQEQVRDVIAYAADRGIRVIPEFDMPGHVTSWMVGYPELASGPGPYQIERHFGIFDPTMDPTKESTYKFLDKFIGEMAKLFPDQYFHVGGDENNGKQWTANPRIQAYMKKNGIETTNQLQNYFSKRVLAIVKKHGKKMIGWDEVLVPGLPKDVVVQSWRGLQSLDAGAKDGYTGILSAPYYFDAMNPSEYVYAADPVPANSPLTAEQKKLILGGESCMWAEELSTGNIESRIWPRNLAIAERFWSPQSVNDVSDLYRRLDAVSVELEGFGLQHVAAQEHALRQIVGATVVPAPVETLMKYVEAYDLDVRHRQFETRQLQQMPLTALADVARIDVPARRLINLNVTRLFNDANFTQGTAELQAAFAELAALDQSYPAAANGNPALEKAIPRAQDLTDLGRAGQEALVIINQGQAVAPDWLANRLALLDRAAKPTAALKIAWLPSFRTLIYMAAYRSTYDPMTQKNWREKVLADSTVERRSKR
jgi:hexosaminidase